MGRMFAGMPFACTDSADASSAAPIGIMTRKSLWPVELREEWIVLLRITENLDIDVRSERWRCHRCSQDLGSARESYKCGCLVSARDPHEVHFPMGPDPEFNFSFDPAWMMIVEFYCPQCATLVETEYLPPGHPLTWDIQLDIDALRRKCALDEARPLAEAKQ
jgi:acetone carboxylase gamma subunit